jgi:hypothetical protein
MSFLKKIFGAAGLDGAKLALSQEKADYTQIALLSEFAPARSLHSPALRQRWSRVLPQPYDETLKLFERQGWLEQQGDQVQVTAKAMPFVETYRARLASEKAAVLPKVRKALQERDTGEALNIRRNYESRQPLGEADWSGPEPQMSHSALTRRILFLNNWLLEDLTPQTADWLKLYAAEQHLWGATWRLSLADLPESVKQELAAPQLDAVEAAYWKANQLMLFVDNQETWQRCKGGDHVRRIEIAGPNDESTCEVCKPLLGKQFLVARVPDLPPRTCTSAIGCRCRYEPVLEGFEEKN